jgi:hypothetical protein
MRFAVQLAVGIAVLFWLWKIPVMHNVFLVLFVVAALFVAYGMYLSIFPSRVPKLYSEKSFELLDAYFANVESLQQRYIDDLIAQIGPWQDHADWDYGRYIYRWHTKEAIFEVSTQSGYFTGVEKLPIEKIGYWFS